MVFSCKLCKKVSLMSHTIIRIWISPLNKYEFIEIQLQLRMSPNTVCTVMTTKIHRCMRCLWQKVRYLPVANNFKLSIWSIYIIYSVPFWIFNVAKIMARIISKQICMICIETEQLKNRKYILKQNHGSKICASSFFFTPVSIQRLYYSPSHKCRAITKFCTMPLFRYYVFLSQINVFEMRTIAFINTMKFHKCLIEIDPRVSDQ